MKPLILNYDVSGLGVEARAILSTLAEIKDATDIELLNEGFFDKVSIIVTRLGVIFDQEQLSKFKNLKIIATITTGLDHIDQQYCKQQGIKIISLRGEREFLESIRATPEHTWGLLLSLIRHIPFASSLVQKGTWERDSCFGTELFGKTIGIVGLGRVGSRIAHYAHAFGMKILAYDIVPLQKFLFDIDSVSLESLFEKSDVIIISVALNESTRHMITRNLFSRLRPSAVLVNTSRGAVIDEIALIEAIEQKKIAGVALDVLEGETNPNSKKIMKQIIELSSHHSNIILTPHIAGSTFESMNKTAVFIASKLRDSLHD